MGMDSNRWNQWLSLAANVGVVLGLILVALELRQTRDAALGATYQNRSMINMEWSKWVAESDYIAPMIQQTRAGGRESLTADQEQRSQSTMLAAIHRLDGFFYQYELGLLEQDYYESVFRAEMRTWVPRWRETGMLEPPWTDYMRPSFREEVQKYLDEAVRF
jgi:hypothetical protein